MSCGIRLKSETSLNERTSLDERQALAVVVDAAAEIKRLSISSSKCTVTITFPSTASVIPLDNLTVMV